MGRRIVKTRGVVIRTRRLGETSKLVTLYTDDYGKLKATAKGARRPRSRFGAALELFNEVRVVCYLRDERDLQTLSECEVVDGHAARLLDLDRMSYASAACEVVERFTLDMEPNLRLYRCLAGALMGLAEVDPPQLEPLFWYYQLRVAAALGYRPELVHCVACRRELAGPWVWFNAARGGGMCRTCGPGGGVRMPGPGLRFLAELQSLRTYRRELIPPVPERPGEIRRALRGFLEFHGGARGPLRALDFLETTGIRWICPTHANGPATVTS